VIDISARRAGSALTTAVLLGSTVGSAAPARAADDASRVLTIIRWVVDLNAGKEISRTTTEGDKVAINLSSDVLFGFGRAELSPGAQRTLKLAADQLAKVKGGVVHVDGYTDAKGRAGVNQPLSAQRAKSVADALGKMLGPACTSRWPATAQLTRWPRTPGPTAPTTRWDGP